MLKLQSGGCTANREWETIGHFVSVFVQHILINRVNKIVRSEIFAKISSSKFNMARVKYDICLTQITYSKNPIRKDLIRFTL